MSDNTPETAATRPPNTVDGPESDTATAAGQEPVYDLVEVPPTASESATSEPATGATAHPDATHPTATDTTATDTTATDTTTADTTAAETESPPRVATSAASMQTIYVPSPVPPRRRGNRGFGALIALLSSAIFAAAYAVVIAAIHAVQIGVFRFDFFGSLAYYTPIGFFFVGFVIVVLLANRAAWWGYVVGSIFVGLFVYFGTVGTGLLANNIFGETPSSAARLYSTALSSPFIIGAALVAREVSMWMGALISARGRRVKVRNLEARDVFERESAERNAEYENSRYGNREASV
jgi:hypothetical protein